MRGAMSCAAALDLVRERGGQTMVELGSIRSAGAQKSDGHSTLARGESSLATWSVDIDCRATRLTTKLLGSRFPRLRCLTCDGIWFLDTF